MPCAGVADKSIHIVDLEGPPADGTFYFHDLGHRCVDFGGRDFWHTGAPVVIYSCNGTIAQQIRVKELDASHDVELRVSPLFCIGVKGGQVTLGQPLELQTCAGSPARRFAVDGDSLLARGTPSAPQAMPLSPI